MGLVGKRVKVFFEDNGQIKPRVAVVIEEGISFLTIKNEFGTEALPNCKIIRVEVLS